GIDIHTHHLERFKSVFLAYRTRCLFSGRQYIISKTKGHIKALMVISAMNCCKALSHRFKD
ncbi:MAG: hypothetical protein ACYST2_05340, partial [Planctomycetota bacterium]